MSKHTDHSFRLEMRLHEARSLLIAINTEETVSDLKTDRMMAALSGIERLIEDAQEDHTRMISALNVSEVLT